jgi:hypothetical protein
MATKEEQDALDKAAADKKAAEEVGKKPDAVLTELMKDPEKLAAYFDHQTEAKRKANEEAKASRLKLEEYEKADRARQEAALQEQGKFKELAEKHKAEAEQAKANLAATLIDFRVEIEAIQAGAIDAEDVKRLIDRSAVKLAADGKSIEGAKEAVDALKASKPHLFKSDVKPNPAQVKPEAKASLRQLPSGADMGESPEMLLERGLKIKK